MHGKNVTIWLVIVDSTIGFKEKYVSAEKAKQSERRKLKLLEAKPIFELFMNFNPLFIINDHRSARYHFTGRYCVKLTDMSSHCTMPFSAWGFNLKRSWRKLQTRQPKFKSLGLLLAALFRTMYVTNHQRVTVSRAYYSTNMAHWLGVPWCALGLLNVADIN